MTQHPHPHTHPTTTPPAPSAGLSVLALPAWLRVAAVLPLLLLLWLAVGWADAGVLPW